MKLIAIHNRHDESENSNYNEGMLFGPILAQILNYVTIHINNNNDYKKVENVIKEITDKLKVLWNREKNSNNINEYDQIFENCFLNISNYYKLAFYKNVIIEESKILNQERFNIYYTLLSNHILTYAHEILGDKLHKTLTILNNFDDLKSTYTQITTFNDDIINCFNNILLSKDFNLKAKLIYFIASYINALDKMKCRYNYGNVPLYHRSFKKLNVLQSIKENENNIIAFKFFIDHIIPDTYTNYLYKIYYDIKMSIKFGYSKTMHLITASDYDTQIYIKQNYDNKKYQINCFQIWYWPDLVITPFTFFKVEKVEINDDEQTSIINLELIPEF